MIQAKTILQAFKIAGKIITERYGSGLSMYIICNY